MERIKIKDKWIKVVPVGRNFGFVGVLEYANGRYIDETEVFPSRETAELAAMNLLDGLDQ